MYPYWISVTLMVRSIVGQPWINGSDGATGP